MQPQPTASAEPEKPQEQEATTNDQEPATEGATEAQAGGGETSDQTTQPQLDGPSDSVAEPKVEQGSSTEVVSEQQESVEQQEPVPSSSSALDAAISATLEGAATQEPPRDSTSTPALYVAVASSAEFRKVDTPTLPSSAKPAPSTKPTSSLSRIAQLTQRVEKDPLDGEAQLALLQEVEAKGDLERTREVYEKFLTTFPDAVSLQIPNPRESILMTMLRIRVGETTRADWQISNSSSFSSFPSVSLCSLPLTVTTMDLLLRPRIVSLELLASRSHLLPLSSNQYFRRTMAFLPRLHSPD